MFNKIMQWFRPHQNTEANDTVNVDYYDEEFEFNTKWVSLDYQGSTASIIKQLNTGDPILLAWSDTPFKQGEHIKVFTSKRKQIGWVPPSNGYFVEERLLEAVKNRWPIDAKVKSTGKVNDPQKNIWWCVVTVNFKVQYTSKGDEVYMGIYNNRYHSKPDCGTALKRRVPLEVAQQYGRIPCPKCISKES